jgi:hypothetical protein
MWRPHEITSNRPLSNRLAGGFRRERAFGRDGSAIVKVRVIDIMSRAIWTDCIIAIAHVDKNVWMIERRQSANAHEFPCADANLLHARLIMEMGCHVIEHVRIRDLKPYPLKQKSTQYASTDYPI